MGKINLNRVISGGLLAGLILNIGEYVLNESILGEDWATLMESLNRPGQMGVGVMGTFVIMTFVLGVACVWMYAAVRPRFGAGPKTAVYAGLIVWFFVWLWGFGSTSVMGIFPTKLVTLTLVWGLVEVPIATLIGSWLYKEE